MIFFFRLCAIIPFEGYLPFDKPLVSEQFSSARFLVGAGSIWPSGESILGSKNYADVSIIFFQALQYFNTQRTLELPMLLRERKFVKPMSAG